MVREEQESRPLPGWTGSYEPLRTHGITRESSPRTCSRRSKLKRGFALASWRRISSQPFPLPGKTAQATALGFEASKVLWDHLKAEGYIDKRGRIQDALTGGAQEQDPQCARRIHSPPRTDRRGVAQERGPFGNQERRQAPPRTRSTVASSGCSCRRPLFRLLPAPKVFAACQFSALLQKLNSSASDSVT